MPARFVTLSLHTLAIFHLYGKFHLLSLIFCSPSYTSSARLILFISIYTLPLYLLLSASVFFLSRAMAVAKRRSIFLFSFSLFPYKLRIALCCDLSVEVRRLVTQLFLIVFIFFISSPFSFLNFLTCSAI